MNTPIDTYKVIRLIEIAQEDAEDIKKIAASSKQELRENAERLNTRANEVMAKYSLL